MLYWFYVCFILAQGNNGSLRGKEPKDCTVWIFPSKLENATQPKPKTYSGIGWVKLAFFWFRIMKNAKFKKFNSIQFIFLSTTQKCWNSNIAHVCGKGWEKEPLVAVAPIIVMNTWSYLLRFLLHYVAFLKLLLQKTCLWRFHWY